jgi:hypothetical protein
MATTEMTVRFTPNDKGNLAVTRSTWPASNRLDQRLASSLAELARVGGMRIAERRRRPNQWQIRKRTTAHPPISHRPAKLAALLARPHRRCPRMTSKTVPAQVQNRQVAELANRPVATRGGVDGRWAGEGSPALKWRSICT